MSTKVTFEKEECPLVKFSDLNPGDAFMWEDMLYIKMKGTKAVRIKGSSYVSSFDTGEFMGPTLVEPLDVEIKFSRQ